MDDIKLPELPARIAIGPTGQPTDYYSADQVRAAVLADREQRNADESDALTVAHMCGYEDGLAVVKESLTPEQEREAFEAWCTNYDAFGISRNYGIDDGDGYDEHDTQVAWEAWQARAALAKGE